MLEVINAEVMTALRSMESGSIHTCVTSPPYFWARDYGVDGQIGHESTVAEYVEKIADVFDEVKRIMTPKGVLFLNIGDTYYSGNGQPKGTDSRSSSRNFMRKILRPVDCSGWDIPKKSMIGVPWQVAFELQKRGWTIRSCIIWNRINAFSEPSAKDRPHRQYEFVFLFSKSRWYYFDRNALPYGEEDVWNIPIERNGIKHNAQFPTELVKRCILAGCPEGGTVLDPFVGSGTTLEVAEKHGRHAKGIELNPKYVTDVLVPRLRKTVPYAELVIR